MDFSHWRTATTRQATADGQPLICRCLNVSESDIREVISEHEPQSVKRVSQICGAGTGCRSCHRQIRRMLDECVLCQRSESFPHH